MPSDDEKHNNGAAYAFLVPYFIGGTYYAFVAVNHISKQPHQPIDFILAVPYAYITLGTCCGIFCLCFWQMAEGSLKFFNRATIVPEDDGKKTPVMQSYQP